VTADRLRIRRGGGSRPRPSHHHRLLDEGRFERILRNDA
jgi:hypothetical protein